MKKHHMPEMKEGGVNVTPLIDVVMCLIIFFILVAKIGVSNGINKNITPPEAYLGVKITDMGNALTLNLYSKGEATDEPLILVDLKGEKQKQILITDPAEPGKKPLQEVMRAMKEQLDGAEAKKARGNSADVFKVIINAGGPPPATAVQDPDAPLIQEMRYGQIQLILQQCAEAGVSNIYFNAKKKTELVEAPKS